jgi:hypothetical protein
LKKIQAKQKEHLKIRYNIFDEFYVIRIFSHETGLRTAWLLNTNLNAAFRNYPEIIIKDYKNDTEYLYQVYIWTSPNNVVYVLLSSIDHSESLTSMSSESFIFIQKKEHLHTIRFFLEKIQSHELFFDVELIDYSDDIKTTIQKKLIHNLENIGIELEQYLLTLKEKSNKK